VEHQTLALMVVSTAPLTSLHEEIAWSRSGRPDSATTRHEDSVRLGRHDRYRGRRATLIDFTAPLHGRRVLIVGGSGDGIGRAITRAVVQAGARGVAVVGSSAEKTRAAVDEIAGDVDTAAVLVGDVRDASTADRTVSEGAQRLGGIDVLITVVGGSLAQHAGWSKVHETSDEHWAAVLDLNLTYVFRFVRTVLKVFLEQETGGAIVSIGSVTGIRSSPQAAAYGVGKSGLVNLAKTVSIEYARQGIRMNVINCGIVGTPRVDDLIASRDLIVEDIPIGRTARPEEVAAAVIYFASSMSEFARGASLELDGGVLARLPTSRFG
jgi:3-oxoacyl-[acyl-carrier protein] reductase